MWPTFKPSEDLRAKTVELAGQGLITNEQKDRHELSNIPPFLRKGGGKQKYDKNLNLYKPCQFKTSQKILINSKTDVKSTI